MGNGGKMTASVGLSSRALQFRHRCTSNITLFGEGRRPIVCRKHLTRSFVERLQTNACLYNKERVPSPNIDVVPMFNVKIEEL